MKTLTVRAYIPNASDNKDITITIGGKTVQLHTLALYITAPVEAFQVKDDGVGYSNYGDDNIIELWGSTLSNNDIEDNNQQQLPFMEVMQDA